MTEQKKFGWITRFFGGSRNNCCSVEFEGKNEQNDRTIPKKSEENKLSKVKTGKK